jgi:hypothetical protein
MARNKIAAGVPRPGVNEWLPLERLGVALSRDLSRCLVGKRLNDGGTALRAISLMFSCLGIFV